MNYSHTSRTLLEAWPAVDAVPPEESKMLILDAAGGRVPRLILNITIGL